MRALLSRVAASTTLGRLYAAAASESADVPFSTRALAALGVSIVTEGAGVPESGPLVVVANHPFGALDGLALLDLVGRVRADVKLLGNHWLAAIPELRPQLLPVDVFG